MSNQVVQGQQSQYAALLFSVTANSSTQPAVSPMACTFNLIHSNLAPTTTPYKSYVQVTVPAITTTTTTASGSSFIYSGIIPAQLRPAVDKYIPMSSIDIGNSKLSLMQITTAGDIIIPKPFFNVGTWSIGTGGINAGLLGGYYI